VREAFARNLAERGERGGAVCVTYDGEVVVDLAGGVADRAGERPWEPDTLAMVWSCTKGALALCLHLLLEAGEVDFEAPVAQYWPQFAVGGKAEATVAMALSHQAGIPGLVEPLATPDLVFDFDAMVERTAAEPARWRPGTQHGYHSFTFGWIVGELIRRAGGMAPGAFLRERVAEPLGLDLWLGLPDAEDHRAAYVEYPPLPDDPEPFYVEARRSGTVQQSVLNSWGRFVEPEVCSLRVARAAGVPGAGGMASARALALLYRPLATDGRIGDVQLSERAQARMRSVQAAGAVDVVTLGPSRFSSGFQKGPVEPGRWPSLPEPLFGHGGQGGSFGYADPTQRLSLGYVTGRHAVSPDDRRAHALIDAVYASLGRLAQPR
jgi:CubicO group peptidase (beta-lactamase class C family)